MMDSRFYHSQNTFKETYQDLPQECSNRIVCVWSTVGNLGTQRAESFVIARSSVEMECTLSSEITTVLAISFCNPLASHNLLTISGNASVPGLQDGRQTRGSACTRINFATHHLTVAHEKTSLVEILYFYHFLLICDEQWIFGQCIYYWATTWDFQQCCMCDQRRLRPACTYVQSYRGLCESLEYSMTLWLLTEHHLDFLNLKGGCIESTLVKIPHCWKSHVTAQLYVLVESYTPVLSCPSLIKNKMLWQYRDHWFCESKLDC